MPAKSPAQARLMEAAAHTPGGYGGVPQKVGKEFVKDSGGIYETETDAARALQDGTLQGPVQFGNVWLFDLRITGTGISYRDQGKEWVYRPSEFYLCDDFLERCQGLPVLFEHPEKSMLNTEEYRNRAIGTVVLPYLITKPDAYHRAGDVWGIARIYDGDAVELMRTTHISTSPGVSGMEGRKIDLDHGEHMLIEGNPRILDHLSVVPNGVWDKGGDPRGVHL